MFGEYSSSSSENSIERADRLITSKNKRQKKVKAKQIRREMEVESSDLSKNEIIEETKEEFNKLKKTVEKSMGQVDGLTCSICMDFIVSCRTAVCGHSFC